MRNLLVTTAAAALLAAVSFANAEEATGSITAIDTAAGTLTLDNGQIYHLPENFDASEWKVGDEVKLMYEEEGDEMSVTSVEAAS